MASLSIFVCLAQVPQDLFQELITIVLPFFWASLNASKVKVVINTDPEAPFFKAADYGIVGDAFEVVPQLIEKLKAFKQA